LQNSPLGKITSVAEVLCSLRLFVLQCFFGGFQKVQLSLNIIYSTLDFQHGYGWVNPAWDCNSQICHLSLLKKGWQVVYFVIAVKGELQWVAGSPEQNYEIFVDQWHSMDLGWSLVSAGVPWGSKIHGDGG
jgi:hypothetical protein